MDTLPVVLVMVAVAALLLCAAVLADRKLQQRAARRRALEEDNAPRKHDAADAFIEMLDRAREAVRRAADEAAQQNSQS